MWSPVTSSGAEEPAPASRCKHSATLLQGHLYLLGGRCGNVPLKDFWRYSLAEGTWTQVQASGEKPPCLQEHSAVAYKDQIYVFGGEVGFSSATETPLWVYSSARDSWRKVRTRRGVQVPRARRGHTALVHRGAMLVYGGYQDLKGSSADLWAFHFETESWHLLSGPGCGAGEMPPARHRHSAVMHEECMWVYGGMTDLVSRADLWRWDTRVRNWQPVRGGAPRGGGPGARHGHAAAAARHHMLLLGGEGPAADEVWRFAFHTEAWERVDCRGDKPTARSDAVALTVSDLQLHVDTQVATRPRTSRSGTRASNKVSPAEGTTYIFPSNATPAGSFISRLAALRGNTCHYTVLHADSTESLLTSTPQRMPKSKSAYNHSSAAGPNITRDPISVPNFTNLEDSPATAKLVRLGDTDDEEDDSGVHNHHQVIQVKPAADNKKIVIYENVGVARGESYSSHLGRVDSTSDYASLSLDMSHSSSSGFCNPNYVAAATLLGSSGAPAEEPGLELENLGKCRRRVGRAASASRAETRTQAVTVSGGPPPPQVPPTLYVFLVGGKEPHVTVFKRPVNIWKLQLY